MAKCDCYYQHGMKYRCYGTKEMEECSCGGDTRKCNFYPEKRKEAMSSALMKEADRRWIPVTEALPRFSPGKWRKVIVTMEDDTGHRFTTTAKYNEICNLWYAFADVRYLEFKVVAWRLKPEVYDG